MSRTSSSPRSPSARRRGPTGSLRLVPAALALLVFASSGCGKPPMHQVQGTVRLGGKPVPGCKVGFFPDATSFDPTRHGFGFGITDADGKYVIQHPQGETGIWAGNYKVTLVAWVNKKGEPLPPDIKPSEVEGGVRNLFPDAYEAPSTTPERAVVRKGEPNEFTFDVPSGGTGR